MTGIVQTLIGGFGAVAAAVTDAYFNLVTLLLPGNGTNGAQNNTFLDSSTNNFTITRNGNTTQGTFSPFSQTGWSNYLVEANNDYLTTNSSASFGISGDFTYEGWVYLTSTAFKRFIMPSSVSMNVDFLQASGNNMKLQFFDGTTVTADAINTFPINTWTHVAVVRSGSGTNNCSFYTNGVRGTQFTTNATNSNVSITIGKYSTNGFDGYISNLRFCKSAVYSGSSFTPPTSPLTTTSQGATNCVLLTCQSNRFVDNSSTAATLTPTGTPSVQAFSPFAPTAAYDAATNGGSGYFDGTGDYVSAAGNAAFSFTGDFTIDGWIYQTAQSTQYYGLFSIGAYTNGVMIRVESSGGVWYLNPFVNSTTPTFPTAALKINLNTWYHVAVVRSGTTVTTYLNGTSAATMTVSGTVNSTNGGVNLGVNDLTQYWAGYVSGFRIIKGSAVVPSGVPTAPPTAITNTTFLTNFTNAGITDATAKNDLETVGNAQISTTQSKFGGSSIYLDGTGDYLRPNSGNIFNFGTGDFTVEFWLYLNSTAAQTFIDCRPGSAGDYILFDYDPTSKLRLYVGSTTVLSGSTLATGQWYHIALARSGSTVRYFINGTQGASATMTTNLLSAANPYIGCNYVPDAYVNGYIDDLRVTKGYARYTANFTAPTAAFPLQ